MKKAQYLGCASALAALGGVCNANAGNATATGRATKAARYAPNKTDLETKCISTAMDYLPRKVPRSDGGHMLRGTAKLTLRLSSSPHSLNQE